MMTSKQNILCLLLLGATTATAEPSSPPLQTSYNYELHFGTNTMVVIVIEDRIVSPHFSRPVERTFVATNAGPLRVEVTSGTNSTVYHSRALPEAVFAIQTSRIPAKDEWLAVLVPDSNTTQPWSECPDDIRRAQPLVRDSALARDIVAAAKPLYESHRPEFIKRYCRSLLFYGEADSVMWTVTQSQGNVLATAGCSDRMYFAQFGFMFKQNKTADWECTAIYGGEFFKGE